MMFGRFDGQRGFVLVLAAFVAMAAPGDVFGQAWELERERGVGGGPSPDSPEVAAKTPDPSKSGKRVGVSIVVKPVDQPVIRPAEGVPVDLFEKGRPRDGDADDAVAAALAEAAAADKAAARKSTAAATPPAADPPIAELADSDARQTQGETTRSAPPTALDLLQEAPAKPIVTSAIDGSSSVDDAPRPAARPRALSDVVAPAPIEQAQFAPNAVARPKTILPPRVGEAPSAGADASIIMPSPKKPAPTQGSVQQAALTPGVGASAKDKVLRTAPATDNHLVELVETPADYVLTLPAGKGRVMNLDKAVSDIFVADPNISDVEVRSPTQLFAHGDQLGQTNMYGIDASGQVIFAIDVEVVPDTAAAQSKLEAVAPAGKTNVTLESGTLVADGAVADVGEAIDVAAVTDNLNRTQGPTVNNTTIDGSQQINIRVRFAEVSRSDVFNLGINWEALVDTGDFLFGLSSGPGVVGEVDAFGSIFGNAEFGDVNIEAFIDALQREGIINLLAEPNLTAINGETANFLAGGEIPIPVPGGAGSDTVTIDYKPFGVSLDFIPTLLPGERINLRVRPEVSSINAAGGVFLDGFAIPAFTVRRAETSVELASGQTFAIAGLFQRDLTTDTDKFPVLGDVPVLGQLFQSQRFQRFETELVILITPYLVKPTSNRNIALPNDRLDEPVKPLVKRNKRRGGFIVN